MNGMRRAAAVDTMAQVYRDAGIDRYTASTRAARTDGTARQA